MNVEATSKSAATIVREIRHEAEDRMKRSESALQALVTLRSDPVFREAVDILIGNFMMETSAPSRGRIEEVSPEYVLGYMHALDLFAHPNYHLDNLRSEQRQLKAKYEFI